MRLPLNSAFACVALILSTLGAIASPQLDRIQRLTAHPERLGRVDYVVVLQAAWTDPFDSSQVRLDLETRAPSGDRVVVPCYYESGASGAPSLWRARWCPVEAGTHRIAFVLTEGTNVARVEAPAVEVAPSARRGFLRVHDRWTLRFDNGESFRGLGMNIGWEARSQDDSKFFRALHEHPRFNYEYMLASLAERGGNIARTWMCPWNLPLEWNRVVDTDRYAPDAARFNASAIRRMDELVALAEQLDVRLMLTLDTAGSFLGGHWALNPYNAANGGPAAVPAEFFTDPAARARYKDRLRYLVARWGYSPHVAFWEFFNEIDNAMYGQQPTRIADDVVVAWHTEMAAHLAALDPHRRPITTSISHREVAGLNDIPHIAINQRHVYGPPRLVIDTLRAHAMDAKPYVVGEYAFEWDWNKDFNAFAAEMDAGFRHGLWYGLFSPTPVLPMSWWWEYFDERGTTDHLRPVRAVMDRMLAAGGGAFEPLEATWEGGAIVPLAVRCGSSSFVLLINDSATAVEGAVRLPPASTTKAMLTVFDAATGTWSAPSRISTRDGLVATGSLPPGAIRILELSTRTNRSRP
jgi:hypothetical protein